MEAREVPIDSLTVPDYCKRHHSREQIDRFIRHWRQNGQYQPVVTSQGEILCGVLVYTALKKAGEKTIWVNDLGPLSLERKKEIRYLDNQIFDIETWNGDRLKSFLMELDTGMTLDYGFSSDEVNSLMNGLDAETAAPVQGRKVALKDVWECPECGWSGTLEEEK